MGGIFAGILKGFSGASAEGQRQAIQQQAHQQELEARVFNSLLEAKDPEVRAIAATGLMETTSPRRGKSFFSRFMGDVQKNPAYEQLVGWMRRGGPPGMEQAPGTPADPTAPAPPPAAPAVPPLGSPGMTPPATAPTPALPGTPQPSAGIMSTPTGPDPQAVAAQSLQPTPPPVAPQLPPELAGTPQDQTKQKVSTTMLPALRPITQSAAEKEFDSEFAKSRAKSEAAQASLRAAGVDDPEELRKAAMIAVGVAPKAKAQTPLDARVENARLRNAAARAVGRQPDEEDRLVEELGDRLDKMAPSERDKFMSAEAYKRSELSASAAWERAKLQTSTSRANTNALVAARIALAGGGDEEAADQIESWAQAVHSGQATLANIPMKQRGQVLNLMRETNRPAWSKDLQKLQDTHLEAQQALEEGALLLDKYINSKLNNPKAIVDAGVAYWNYSKFTESFVNRMAARAAGEKGVMTQQDVAAFKKFLDIGGVMTKVMPEQAQQRIELAMNLLNSIQERRMKAYTARVGGTPAGGAPAAPNIPWKKPTPGKVYLDENGNPKQ